MARDCQISKRKSNQLSFRPMEKFMPAFPRKNWIHPNTNTGFDGKLLKPSSVLCSHQFLLIWYFRDRKVIPAASGSLKFKALLFDFYLEIFDVIYFTDFYRFMYYDFIWFAFTQNFALKHHEFKSEIINFWYKMEGRLLYQKYLLTFKVKLI